MSSFLDGAEDSKEPWDRQVHRAARGQLTVHCSCGKALKRYILSGTCGIRYQTCTCGIWYHVVPRGYH